MNFSQYSGLFILLLFIVITGIRLRHTGPDYGTVILALHKILSLGVLILYIRQLYLINKTHSLNAVLLATAVGTILCFAGTIITGGLSTTDKFATRPVLTLHRILPILTIAAVALTQLLIRGQVL